MRKLDILRELTALYVEDDPIQTQQMCELLGGFFHTLLVAESGAVGLEHFDRHPVHVVIADLRMPQMDGIAMVEAIRKRDAQIPILITSAYAERDDLLAAIRLHLIDYLIKPLSWEKLKSALEQCAHRIIESGSFVVQLADDSWFSPPTGKLIREGSELSLTTKEKELLELLISHRGQVVTRERIFLRVYAEDENPSDSALKNLVLKLRRKIGEDTIVNSYGAGYMLRHYAQA